MKVIVENLSIEYQDSGSGNTFLFLHGWQDNLHSFDGITPSFLLENRVVSVDLPGFGGSDTPSNSWNLDDYAHFVSIFIKKIGIFPTVLIGHSFGGRVIIKGVSSKLFNPEKIILIAAAGIKRKNSFLNSFLKIIIKFLKILSFLPPFLFFRDMFRKKVYNFFGSDYISAGKMKETFVKIINEDLSSQAQKITIPTLLIWGGNDKSTPLWQGEVLSNLMQNSNFNVVDGAGHFVHQEKQEEVIKIMKDFLC